jgi:hypothetical protein
MGLEIERRDAKVRLCQGALEQCAYEPMLISFPATSATMSGLQGFQTMARWRISKIFLEEAHKFIIKIGDHLIINHSGVVTLV